MSGRIVDMVTSQLMDVSEVFKRLDPSRIADLMAPEVVDWKRWVVKKKKKLASTCELLPGNAVPVHFFFLFFKVNITI